MNGPDHPLAFWRSRRCGLKRAARASASTPTTAPSRMRWAGSVRRCSSTKVATGAKKPLPAWQILVGRRDDWYGCTLTAALAKTCQLHGTPVFGEGGEIGRLTTSAYHYELGPIALAVVKYATPDDALVTVGTGDLVVSATMDPIVARDDSPRPGQVARAAFPLALKEMQRTANCEPGCRPSSRRRYRGLRSEAGQDASRVIGPDMRRTTSSRMRTARRQCSLCRAAVPPVGSPRCR